MTKNLNRPLSPHLSIYKPQISSVLSISHRLSGFYLYFGLLILAWNIIFSVLEPNIISSLYLKLTSCLFECWVGKILLFFWSLALFYHPFNGIRHLFWDVGIGFAKESVVNSGIFIVCAAILCNLLVWAYVLNFFN